MTRVVVTPSARDDLTGLIRTHSLPPDTWARVIRSLRPLAEFPLLGAPLGGRWEGFRFILGPWRWMIIVHVVDDRREQVSVVTIQDARSATSPDQALGPPKRNGCAPRSAIARTGTRYARISSTWTATSPAPAMRTRLRRREPVMSASAITSSGAQRGPAR